MVRLAAGASVTLSHMVVMNLGPAAGGAAAAEEAAEEAGLGAANTSAAATAGPLANFTSMLWLFGGDR